MLAAVGVACASKRALGEEIDVADGLGAVERDFHWPYGP